MFQQLQKSPFNLAIEKCSGNKCAKKDEIDKYINKILIIVSAIYQQTDFEKRGYDNIPVFQYSGLIKQFKLHSDQFQDVTLLLKRNHIETKDYPFNPLGQTTIEHDFYDVGKFQSYSTVAPAMQPNGVMTFQFRIDDL